MKQNIPGQGGAEQDLEQMISQTMLVCREAVANCSVSPVELTSVGFSTQGCVTIAVDQKGQILRPLISWQDIRPQQELEDNANIIAPEKYYSITGMPLIANLIVNKIDWIRKHILHQTEEEIKEMDKEIQAEREKGLITTGTEEYY